MNNVEEKSDFRSEFFHAGGEFDLTGSREYANFIPPYILTQIKKFGKDSTFGKQYLPSFEELGPFQINGLIDPIGDQVKFHAPQLIHRYKNRVLFLATFICPISCRFCFRKNEINSRSEIFNPDFAKTLAYLKENPQINEVIFSGGDPFILSDKKLKFFLTSFAEIAHIKKIRFHTRTPMTIPSRVNEQFNSNIKSFDGRFNFIYVIHCNHALEFQTEVNEAIKELKKSGIVLSQSVLLKGINDNKTDLINLFEKITSLGVIPYYLHHPDKVKGAMHFYLSTKEGLALYEEVKKELSGWCCPKYVIDSPSAFGKALVSHHL